MAKTDTPIFIGYRRRDSQGFAGRVADDLIDEFGVTRIFRDDDIPEGSDYTLVLEQALNQCSVLIAVIGPNWLKALDPDGHSRLHQPDDWVRREIEAALQRGIWVLPVLVGDASMPSMEDLPESLGPFAKVQAVKMSDRGWEEDLARLVLVLKKRIPSLNAITENQRSAQFTPSPRDTMARLAQTILRKQYTKRSSANRFSRVLGNLIVRALWFSGLLLLVWYLFENHATPEIRKYVFEFIAFAQNKITHLVSWFLSE